MVGAMTDEQLADYIGDRVASKTSVVVQLALLGWTGPGSLESFAAMWRGQFWREAARVVLL